MLYIYRFCPEIILYSINKFKSFSYFKGEDFKKFLQVRYKESLNTTYNEEQLYYYYAIKVLGFASILEETNDNVFESNNQVLISYYLKDGIFSNNNIERLKSNKSEQYWFQNYHLILFTDLFNEDKEYLIKEYLMPESIRYNPKNKESIKNKQDLYINFYKLNLENRNLIINNIEKINESLEEYIDLKIEERIEVFGDDEE